MLTKKNTIIIVLVFITSLSFAQKHNHSEGTLGGLKVGIVESLSSIDFLGLFIGGEFSKVKKNTIYTAELAYGHELRIFSGLPMGNFTNLGALYGKLHGIGVFWLQYQGGLAAIYGRETGSENPFELWEIQGRYTDGDTYFTGGLLGKIVFKIIPTKWLDIGLEFELIASPQQILYTTGIGLEFGISSKKTTRN